MKNENCLTKKQLEAIRHIRNWLMHKGYAPSIRELMADLSYKSPRSVQDILEQLQEKGVIKKFKNGDYQLIRDLDFGSMHAQTTNIPIVGTVACGTPILAEENIEGFIPVSTALAKPGSKYYLLHAQGDSMDKAGINDGDLVLVRQQSTANEGDRVVALINEEATIKEFHRTQNMIILRPKSSNEGHKPIILTDDFQIQGVVIAVIPKESHKE
ncbi:MAG: transcriptional repressor LexA [Candidatus Omnitrophica bacterium]|nr:transcriptional repressor LexA [Candidatus Omnitrophota bacterium]